MRKKYCPLVDKKFSICLEKKSSMSRREVAASLVLMVWGLEIFIGGFCGPLYQNSCILSLKQYVIWEKKKKKENPLALYPLASYF